MKVLKLIGGYLALGWFFLFVDQSGIGFDKNVKAVHKWASGETPKLHFVQYWKMTAQGSGRKAEKIPAPQEMPEDRRRRITGRIFQALSCISRSFRPTICFDREE